jgi:hypothetical protein
MQLLIESFAEILFSAQVPDHRQFNDFICFECTKKNKFLEKYPHFRVIRPTFQANQNVPSETTSESTNKEGSHSSTATININNNSNNNTDDVSKNDDSFTCKLLQTIGMCLAVTTPIQ